MILDLEDRHDIPALRRPIVLLAALVAGFVLAQLCLSLSSALHWTAIDPISTLPWLGCFLATVLIIRLAPKPARRRAACVFAPYLACLGLLISLWIGDLTGLSLWDGTPGLGLVGEMLSLFLLLAVIVGPVIALLSAGWLVWTDSRHVRRSR
ncbi:hypothetical protein [Salinicola rhizosphaerae]|uniref:Transmembrane protein n=1 Tax=Salinicola rhizosphaerae TaxID=1443141 RepID=A0ABQ3DVW5_9GAMM|nr:hypothetical protein [Salinicola rhizosphaerae]GHB13633.1 hypothetical protein GCM10009038_09840 [Salinicola rhizosphaerae]